MDPVILSVIKALILPPGVIVLCGASGLLLWQFRKRLGATLMIVSMLTLYLLSVPFTADRLIAGLEDYPALGTAELERPQAQAIVVLGSGRYPAAPEYRGDTVSVGGLARLRYAAWLHRRTGLPLLVSGGSAFGEAVPEAVLMRRYLQDEIGIEVRWTEISSRNTAENAVNSAQVLREAGIESVYLVTHAWHMRRALFLFTGTGLSVIPAPTGFISSGSPRPAWMQWLPGMDALQGSARALHEMIGIRSYALTGTGG